MDRNWMKYPHKQEYVDGLREFLAIAKNHLDGLGRTRCPCMKCNNSVFKPIEEVEKHLFRIGMQKDYNPWVFHGGAYEVLTDDEDEDDDNDEPVRYDGLEDMLEDIGASIRTHNFAPINTQQDEFDVDNTENASDSGFPDVDEGDDLYDKLLREARKPLYPGCEDTSMLDFLVKLLHVKNITHGSNKSFDMNIQIIKKAFPQCESLPKSYYDAKTLLRKLGLGYVKIHACINDCVLFRKEYEHLDQCPICKEPRYTIREGKCKKVPQKILRHFPLKKRLQRLFMSRMTAEDMRWHKEKRAPEKNVFRHPSDSKVWEDFDKEHEWFSSDPRNVRLGLASDGFNPFGNMSNAYSMWPVMLIPYNLPPRKCMKEPFIYMSLLIPGPTAPGRTRRIRNDGNSAQAPNSQEGPGGRSNRINHPQVHNTQDGASGSGGRRNLINNPQVQNTQDGASGSGTKKNVRQKTVNNKLTEFLRMGGAKPRIEFEPELNVPLGPWAAEWSNELGLIARQHVPLSCHTWKDVEGPQKATLFEQKRFDVDFSDAHVVSAVDGHIKQLYKNYRHTLHSYYKGLADNVDKTLQPRSDVSLADWALLCAHWETDEFKKKSTTNKRSREAVKVLHRAGTKNYARHRFDLRDPETNEQPNSVCLYKSTHHNLEKGWVAPLAEENYENMMEMLSQPTEEGKDRTPDEVRVSVLGKRPGYACGLGYGYVVPTQRSAAGAAATAVAREEMEQLGQRAEIAENKICEQQRVLEQIMSRLGGGFT